MRGRQKSLTTWRVVTAKKKPGNLTHHHEKLPCIFQPVGLKMRGFFYRYRHSPIQAAVNVVEGLAQMKILYKSELNTHMANCTCVHKGVQLKSNLQHNWNLIYHSMAVPPTVLSPSSILPPEEA
jgi:hypothetical protein